MWYQCPRCRHNFQAEKGPPVACPQCLGSEQERQAIVSAQYAQLHQLAAQQQQWAQCVQVAPQNPSFAQLCDEELRRAGAEMGAIGRIVEFRPDPHNAARNALADTCQMLRDENTKLLAENARLRRSVERLERKR